MEVQTDELQCPSILTQASPPFYLGYDIIDAPSPQEHGACAVVLQLCSYHSPNDFEIYVILSTCLHVLRKMTIK